MFVMTLPILFQGQQKKIPEGINGYLGYYFFAARLFQL